MRALLARLRALLLTFVLCHEGQVNRALHLAGGLCVLLGAGFRSFPLMLVGVALQEGGHVYQYVKTRDRRHSPLTCFRPQLVFAAPLLILLALSALR